MLIARAPLRISYAGGGTDLESYYREHGGLVVSGAINKYFYVFVSPDGDASLQVSSADYRAFLRYEEEDGEPAGVGGELKHAEAAFKQMGIRSGYSVFMASQVPSGTGLGSSSAVAVALVKALSTLRQRALTKEQLAEAACGIELDELRMPIGRQDQYASAFGGINAIRFSARGVEVEPLDLDLECLRRLEASTMLFYTGLVHDSAKLLREQRERASRKEAASLEALHLLKRAAEECRSALLDGHPDQVGEIMDAAWQAKKRLSSGVTNRLIDDAYDAARQAGARGGKIAGAGGGGFMLLYCPPAQQKKVTAALRRLGLVRTDFRFDFAGARVLMNNVVD